MCMCCLFSSLWADHYPLDKGCAGAGAPCQGVSNEPLLLGLSVAASSWGLCWARKWLVSVCVSVSSGPWVLLGWLGKWMVPALGSPSSCSLLLPLEPEMASVALAWEHTWGKSLLWQSSTSHSVLPQQWHLASLMGSVFFCIHPWLPHSSSFRLSPSSHPKSSPRSDLQSLNFSIQHPLPTALVDKCLRLGSNDMCRSVCSAFSDQWLHSPPGLQISPSIWVALSTSERTSLGMGNIPFSQLPPLGTGPVLIPFFFFSLLLIVYPSWIHGDFLALSEVWGLLPAFNKSSVWIVPQVFVYLWKKVSSTAYSFTTLIALH